MEKTIWIKVDPWDKELATTALENGADGLVIPPGYSDTAKSLGRIQTVSEDGDLKIGTDVVYYTVTGNEDEEEIARLAREKKVILTCSDWTVIPIENLIARGASVIAQAEGIDEAKTAFGILEKGVDHILYNPSDSADLKKALEVLKSENEGISLDTAEITELRPLGMGDRVCVDTCSDMQPGEGMLVGNASSALFLVHSESVSNPYVAPRPFRVNAGPVHAYTRVPGGKTRYLSELSSGDEVLLVNHKGDSVPAIVGRLKIEKRPLMLVKAKVKDREISTILQNAETIRLTDPEGNPVSVSVLKPGDHVLAATEDSGRHFGMKIDETITEK
ncbi:MAG: 3-dehydroquinate synthase II [Desulfobacteraceae bacterium]|nr:3-dehydroquinate synthase II [Desulfobacteraceae bacterium]